MEGGIEKAEKVVVCEKLTAKEKWMYGLGGLGQNILYTVIGSFLMFFLTDVYGIDPIATGTMMMIARIWDAVNDPIMGMIVEKTRTRFGKLRPYIIFSIIPIALFTVLNFLAPNFGSPTMKLIWCYAVYLLWDLAYTMSDIPYWGLSAAMTNDSEERTKLLTMTRILTMVGVAIAVIGIPILIGALGGATTPEAAARISRDQNIRAYTLMAIICAVIGCGLFTLAFFGTRERFTDNHEKATVKANLKALSKNTPLILILTASIIGFGRNMTATSGMHVAMWSFNNIGYYTILGGVMMGATILAIAVTPLILKYWTKKKLFIYSSLFGVVINLSMYIAGRILTKGTMSMSNTSTIYICIGFLFVASLAGGFFTILETAMIGDSVDYMEDKTGIRAEGLCFSGQTFATKLSSALCIFVFGIMLSASGYINSNALSQPVAALDQIFQSATIWPAIGCGLSIIPILWYSIDEKKNNKKGSRF